MTIMVIEGFDNVSSAQDLFAGILSSANATSQSSFAVSNATQFGGKCLAISTNDPTGAASAAYTSLFFSTASSVIVAGTSILLSSTANSGCIIGFTHNLIGQVYCEFVLNHVSVYTGDPVSGNAILGMSAPSGLTSSGWAYIEMKVNISPNPSVGTLALYINGSQLFTTTFATSSDGTSVANGFFVGAFDASGNGFTASYDNIYVLDNFGIAPNNDLLGPTRVVTRTPSSNAGVQFTSSSLVEPNWQQVNEVNFDGDVSYNFSSAVGATDTFAAFALPATTSQVFAIQVKASVRKDDAGNRAMGTALVSSGTTASGAIYALSPAYQYVSDIYPVDPHTSTAWTTSAVNFSTFGYTLLS